MSVEDPSIDIILYGLVPQDYQLRQGTDKTSNQSGCIYEMALLLMQIWDGNIYILSIALCQQNLPTLTTHGHLSPENEVLKTDNRFTHFFYLLRSS